METLFGLNLLDFGSAVILLLLTLYGAWRGMARLVLGVVGLAAAWIVATRFSESLALRWGAGSEKAEALRGAPQFIHLAAFAFLFLAVAAAASILGWFVSKALGAVMLGWLDRLLGAGLGLLFGVLLVCALSIPVASRLPADGPLLRESVLAPYAIAGGEWIQAVAPEKMRRRFAEVAKALREPPVPAAVPNAPKAGPAPRPR